ncbi:MAG: response regulator [Bacteroidia bacterium]
MKPKTKPASGYQKKPTAHLTIFVVDNEPGARHSIEQQFKIYERFKVYTFRSGEDCFHFFNRLKPDLVIIDYSLNSTNPLALNGLELLKKLRRINPLIPVLFVSEHDKPEDASKAFRNGAFDFILKTENEFFNLRELCKQVLQPVFERKKALVEKQQRRTVLVYLIISFCFFLILFHFLHLSSWTAGSGLFFFFFIPYLVFAKRSLVRQATELPYINS